MELIKKINKAIGLFCVVMVFTCIGYAISSGQNHVFFTAILYALIAWGIFAGAKADKERDE